MSRIEVWEHLTEIFRNVFNDKDLTIYETTSAADIENWDFINQIAIVMEVQEKWNFEIDLDQIDKLDNVGCFIDVILDHINKEAA